ncbi:hypothetical protein TNCV_1840511 [Trichonephila clavipes]|nr:hypothetical protein TNCV_1840511 [Trichonephila clavipes]
MDFFKGLTFFVRNRKRLLVSSEFRREKIDNQFRAIITALEKQSILILIFSCDLTPLDYFLWGYVKSLVYADKPQTLDHLEDNIRRVIADIRPQMLEKVIENWTSRLDYIRASRSSPMPEIIFKI